MLAAVILLALAVLVLAGLLVRSRRDGAAQLTLDILDHAHEAFVAIDSEGTVTAWNRAAETMFGWSREEAVGRDLAELALPVQPRSAYREGLGRARASGQGPMIGPRKEVIAHHRDGAEIPVEVSISAVREPGGSYGFHAFVRDITERQAAGGPTARAAGVRRALGAPRLAHLAAQPARLGRGAGARAGALAAGAAPDVRRRDRPRPLQGLQRRQRPSGGRPCPAPLRLGLEAGPARLGLHRPLRGRGVRGAVARLRASTRRWSVIERLRKATPEGQKASAGVAEWNRYEDCRGADRSRRPRPLHRQARRPRPLGRRRLSCAQAGASQVGCWVGRIRISLTSTRSG